MDWFEVTDSNGHKHLINANHIIAIEYSEDTNLTIIVFNRSAYPALYVRGNIMTDIKRLLNSHNNYVSRIGE